MGMVKETKVWHLDQEELEKLIKAWAQLHHQAKNVIISFEATEIPREYWDQFAQEMVHYNETKYSARVEQNS